MCLSYDQPTTYGSYVKGCVHTNVDTTHTRIHIRKRGVGGTVHTTVHGMGTSAAQLPQPGTPGGTPLPRPPGSGGNAEEPSCTGLEVEHPFGSYVKF